MNSEESVKVKVISKIKVAYFVLRHGVFIITFGNSTVNFELYKVMSFIQMQLMLTLATVIQPTASKALKRKHDQTL